MTLAEQRLAGTDGLGPPGFTLPTLQRVMFGNRNLSAELARDTTVSACQASGRADLAEACTVLAALGHARATPLARRRAVARVLDPAVRRGHPIDGRLRPRPIRRHAARDRRRGPEGADGADRRGRGPAAKGIALDVPLGDLQASRAAARIPIHGCSEGEGCFNIVSTERDDQGRYDPFTGASFVLTAAFDTAARCAARPSCRTHSPNPSRRTTPTRSRCSREAVADDAAHRAADPQRPEIFGGRS